MKALTSLPLGEDLRAQRQGGIKHGIWHSGYSPWEPERQTRCLTSSCLSQCALLCFLDTDDTCKPVFLNPHDNMANECLISTNAFQLLEKVSTAHTLVKPGQWLFYSSVRNTNVCASVEIT